MLTLSCPLDRRYIFAPLVNITPQEAQHGEPIFHIELHTKDAEKSRMKADHEIIGVSFLSYPFLLGAVRRDNRGPQVKRECAG